MPLARRVAIVSDRLRLTLEDGRVIERPLRWYPIPSIAPERVRRKVRVAYAGSGIVWPDLGYELGVDGIIRQRGPLKF